jgi:hypothetical protein
MQWTKMYKLYTSVISSFNDSRVGGKVVHLDFSSTSKWLYSLFSEKQMFRTFKLGKMLVDDLD